MKEFIRQVCPPLLWNAVSRARRSVSPATAKRMFGGVYQRFDEIADEHPWQQPAYRDQSAGQLREAPTLHPTARPAHAILTALINTLPPGRAPRILDWGGGTGLRFWTTRPSLNRSVEWIVVDNPELAALSREIKGTSPELSFVSELPAPSAEAFDIVLIFSALQYIEDQDSLLAALAAHRPRYFVLPRLMAHDDESYVTRQTLLGRATPCKVSSIAALTRTLADRGYERIVMMDDGIDLSPLFDDDVPAALKPGNERLLVFREAA